MLYLPAPPPEYLFRLLREDEVRFPSGEAIIKSAPVEVVKDSKIVVGNGWKRVRFEVLKRDNFTCQYCGRKPPEIKLQVDHIIPVSRGGKDVMENLRAACWDCNIGKFNILL